MKIGDRITVRYVSAHKKTSISFMKITKIGKKYIYGVTLWNSQQDVIREGHPTKYDINKIVVYPGIRQDLRDRLDKYEEDYRQWQNDRNKKDRDIDWEIRNIKQERLGIWEQDNPMPQVPEFPPN